MDKKKRTLISCAMLADEVNHILQQTDIDLPVIWVERGLHSTPEKLNRILQHYIDALQNQDEILLTLGFAATEPQDLSANIRCFVSRVLTTVLISYFAKSLEPNANRPKQMRST